MKILFFIASLRSGGAERVGTTLCNHWASIGHNVIMVTEDVVQNDFYQLVPTIQRYTLNTYQSRTNIFTKLSALMKRIFSLRRIMRQVKPDVVLAFMPTSNMIATLAAMRTGIPVVISERVYPQYFHDGDLFDRIRKFIYKFADAIS